MKSKPQNMIEQIALHLKMVARTPREFENGAEFVASIPLSNPTE